MEDSQFNNFFDKTLDRGNTLDPFLIIFAER
jgi:hypothetical protein